MHADKVQLKQEELVGNGVVLTDINPVTATEAVMDESNGSTLAETLDRIYNIINSKLSRYVNSVNDRSGVVVLTASDVGLGKVDNVSFADIKEWVLEQINQAFRNKQLHLYNNMTDVLIDKETNDKSLDGTPFYAETGQIGDNRAYIGYFFWDDVSNTLQIDYKPIRTIGSSDGSISYDGNTGNISVQIHPSEDALQTTPLGMMIDDSKISRPCIFVDSLYGTGNQSTGTSDPTSMLATINKWKGAPIRIFINDTEIFDDSIDSTSPHYLNSEWEKTLRYGDTIITNFKSYINNAGQLPGYQTGSIACYDLQGQQPAIGSVTSVPDPDDPTSTYEVRFYTIKPFIGGNEQNGCGLKYFQTHQSRHYSTGQLGINLATGINSDVDPADENYSGMQALFTGAPNPAVPDAVRPEPHIQLRTPWGYISTSNGMSIVTDSSLCTYPTDLTLPSGDVYVEKSIDSHHQVIDTDCFFGSKIAKNWSIPKLNGDTSVALNPTPSRKTPEKGYASSDTCLSLKLNKLQAIFPSSGGGYVFGPYKSFTDISGLKVSSINDAHAGVRGQELLNELGIVDGKDAVGNTVDALTELGAVINTGGCMINVGKFLEICPKVTETADRYHDSGKLQVRIGNGLREETNLVNIDTEPDDWSYNYMAYQVSGNGVITDVPTNMVLSTTDPGDDWEKTYFEYYTNTGTPEDPVYTKVQRVVTPGAEIPTWEADTYYSKVPYSFAYIVDEMGFNVFKTETNNRIGLNIDCDTLDFTHDGRLTVIGGGSGGSDTCIRFIDNDGASFDTADNSPEEFVKLGPGMKIIGGQIPFEIRFDAIRYCDTMLELIANGSVLEVYGYYRKLYPSQLNTASLSDILASIQYISAIIESMTTTELDGAWIDWTDVSTNYANGVLSQSGHEYLSGNYQSIYDRVYAMMESIDRRDDKATLFQRIVDHYSLTCTANKTGIQSSIMTMPFIDMSETNPYLFDWLFELGFLEAE